MLAGLHYAHELTDYGGASAGVVHRDVSPHNVFVTYDGQVKLMDFGVAKSVAAAHQTRPGAIKGKLAYLAPEHLRSDAVDRRADIFAAGVMLWELLAGRRLWQGMTEAEIVHALAIGKPAPAAAADFSRPPVLDGICARALAMNPERALRDRRRAGERASARAGRRRRFARADARARRLARVRDGARGARGADRARPGDGAAGGERRRRATKTPSWTKEIEVFLSVPDEMLEVTVVDPPVDRELVARRLEARQRWRGS